MSTVSRLFAALKEADEGFYHSGFFRIPGVFWGRTADGLDDPFFASIRRRPNFPFTTDPFAVTESTGSGAALDETIIDIGGEAVDPSARVKYSFVTKKTVRIGESKRGIVARRKGDRMSSTDNKESFVIIKKIGKMQGQVKKSRRTPARAGQPAVETKTEFKNLESFDEEERFLNDWSLFGPFSPIEAGTVITEDGFAAPEFGQFDSPTRIAQMKALEGLDEATRRRREGRMRRRMERRAARAARRRRKHLAKKRWYDQEKAETPGEEETETPGGGGGVPYVFYCASVRTCVIGANRCLMETKRTLTNDAKESYTITKKLNDRKVAMKWEIHKGRTVRITKNYKNVTRATEEQFVRDYEAFLGVRGDLGMAGSPVGMRVYDPTKDPLMAVGAMAFPAEEAFPEGEDGEDGADIGKVILWERPEEE